MGGVQLRHAVLAGAVGLTVLLPSVGGERASAAAKPKRPVAPAVPSTTPPAAGPAATSTTCDRVAGTLLGQTGQWRIVQLVGAAGTDPEATLPIVACRRDATGPAMVRVIATSKLDGSAEGGTGDFGGPYVSLSALGGSRAILTSVTYPPRNPTPAQEGTQVSSTTVVDLDRGAATQLPGDYTTYDGTSEWPQSYLVTELGPGGAMASFSLTKTSATTAFRTSQLTIWDGAGLRTVPVTPTTIAPSLGTGEGSRGFYYLGADGAAGRIPTDGGLALEGVPDDPAMAWQSLALPGQDGSNGNGVARRLDGPSAVTAPYYESPPWLMRFAEQGRQPTVRVVADASGTDFLATLAKGSSPELKVLDAGVGTAMLAGRFAAHPRERRIRVVGVSRPTAALFDIPSRPALEAPGNAVVGYRRIALIDGGVLRIAGRNGPTKQLMPGAHDLALSDDASGIFVTNGAGTALYTTG